MKPKKFDSINVVPMIDIMLVLLVIVLTTATFIAKGVIPLNLPDGKSAKRVSSKAKRVKITISKDNQIFVDKDRVDSKRLKERLIKLDKNSTIFISCDRDSRYSQFVKVIDTLKELNISKINIVTKKE
jgi:biopolymer transport protein ExbD